MERSRVRGIVHYFDLDDTLFYYENHNSALTYVIKDGEIIHSLTPKEYSEYELGEGETYDYREFENADRFGETAKPIYSMFAWMRTLISQGYDVKILTARNYFSDMDRFHEILNEYGINVPTLMAGSRDEIHTSHERKKLTILDEIAEFGYNDIHLYDDSINNLKAFKSISWTHDVKLTAVHINHSGFSTEVKYL